MMWLDGSPLERGIDLSTQPCFLLEFPEGDRFVVVRLTYEGMLSLSDGGLVSDKPKRHHVIHDPGDDLRMR